MRAETNSVINNLCEKLGTSAQYLIPELIKAKTAECILMIIIDFVILCIVSIVMWKIYKYCKDKDNYLELEDIIVYELIPLVIGLIAVVCLLINVVNLSGWMISPTGKAVSEIISMLK